MTRALYVLMVVVLAATAFAYLLPSEFAGNDMASSTGTQSSSTTMAGSTSSAPTSPAQKTPADTTLHKEVAAAGNTECTFDSVAGNETIHTTLQMSGGTMYGEFHKRGEAGSNVNLYYDGVYAYTWPEGMKQGRRNTVSTIADLKTLIPVDLSGGTIFGSSSNNVSWDCHPWIPVSSKLKVPSNVSF